MSTYDHIFKVKKDAQAVSQAGLKMKLRKLTTI